ncbi:unnamed protein product [Prorocentrum cordatum]|uniref:Cyclic nucleotide-binding domain-containing protein n=1 Tax=Prorocentrum cordatum TaxID=2364126 RepID=A0ABN9WY57_9DINO|nr:unnamed protein product [Polarella glacialis]
MGNSRCVADAEATEDIGVGVDHRTIRLTLSLLRFRRKAGGNRSRRGFRGWAPIDGARCRDELHGRLRAFCNNSCPDQAPELDSRRAAIENALKQIAEQRRQAEADIGTNTEASQHHLHSLIDQRRAARKADAKDTVRGASSNMHKKIRAAAIAQKSEKTSNTLAESKDQQCLVDIRNSGKSDCITSAIDENGTERTDINDIAEVFASFFGSLYDGAPGTYCCEASASQVTDVTPDEVLSQLRRTRLGNAPDEGGAGAYFGERAMLTDEGRTATVEAPAARDHGDPEAMQDVSWSVSTWAGDKRKFDGGGSAGFRWWKPAKGLRRRAPAAGLPLALDARAAEPLTPPQSFEDVACSHSAAPDPRRGSCVKYGVGLGLAPVASLARPPAADGRRCPGPSAVARGAAAAVAARLFVGGRARRKPSAACSPATGSRATDHDALSDLRDVNLSKREADWRRLFQEDECDCEIVGTVVDVPGLLSAQECDALVAAADRRASQVGWRAAQHLNYRTDDVKVRTLGDPDAIELFRSRVEGPLIAQIERSFGLPAEDWTWWPSTPSSFGTLRLEARPRWPRTGTDPSSAPRSLCPTRARTEAGARGSTRWCTAPLKGERFFSEAPGCILVSRLLGAHGT